MNRTLVSACAVLALLMGSAASVTSSTGYAGVDAALHSAAQKAKVVSLQFAAAHHGAVVHTYNTGHANVASGTAVTDKTIFAIESCSKSATAMAAMKMIEAGKFSLDTKVFDYLALGKPKSSQVATITVVELMNHSAGLPDEIKDNDPTDVMNKAKAVLGLSKLLFTPGKDQKYSNVGFAVLGAMVEKASGEKYQQYVEGHVFKRPGSPTRSTKTAAKRLRRRRRSTTPKENAPQRDHTRRHGGRRVDPRRERRREAPGGVRRRQDRLEGLV